MYGFQQVVDYTEFIALRSVFRIGCDEVKGMLPFKLPGLERGDIGMFNFAWELLDGEDCAAWEKLSKESS
ncbi:hypothetical protein GCM10023091_36720 [Ravibacter arvi]|uniref:Uncharacterized protein n=1 Tax=Ravibacter arvi TaxID=2051041 RepID=A0ABP8M8H2_9BACT